MVEYTYVDFSLRVSSLSVYWLAGSLEKGRCVLFEWKMLEGNLQSLDSMTRKTSTVAVTSKLHTDLGLLDCKSCNIHNNIFIFFTPS